MSVILNVLAEKGLCNVVILKGVALAKDHNHFQPHREGLRRLWGGKRRADGRLPASRAVFARS